MPETTPLIKAALNLRVGVGFDVYEETRDKREIEANAFALAYCRLLSSRCNDSKNEWYKTPEEFGPDVYALSDEYAEKFDLPKSNQAN